MTARTFVIGDIHGALRALEQLIEKVVPIRNDTLIFLGDYVDGWSESAQVIEYLMLLETRCNCIFIRGNHDLYCEAWLNGGEMRNSSGKLTVESYKTISEEKKILHRAFFARMKYYHIDEENRLFLHAGFTNNEGPQAEFPATNLTYDRKL